MDHDLSDLIRGVLVIALLFVLRSERHLRHLLPAQHGLELLYSGNGRHPYALAPRD
jgi:hypothetical protein